MAVTLKPMTEGEFGVRRAGLVDDYATNMHKSLTLPLEGGLSPDAA